MNKPEKLFTLTHTKIIDRLLSVVLEVEEKYDDEEYGDPDNIDEATSVLMLTITQLRKMQPEYWITSNIMRFIFLMAKEQDDFLYVSSNLTKDEKDARRVFDALSKKSYEPHILVFAARWILYYYRTWQMDEEVDDVCKISTLYLYRIEEECSKDVEKKKIKVAINNGDNVIRETTREILKLKKYLDARYVEQEEIKKAVSVKMIDYMLKGKRDVMLWIGPTGCGKTFLVDLLQKYPEFNDMEFFRINASLLTPEGFTGQSITSHMNAIERRMDFLKKKKAVIILDEIDKIMVPVFDSKGANVHLDVQYSLMNIVSGNEKSLDVPFTSNYMFILMGAFVELDNLIKLQEKSESIGFTTGAHKEDVLNGTLRDQLVAMGCAPEFLGRITTIIRNKKLSKEALKEIAVNEKFGVLIKRQEEFREMGKELIIDDEAVECMAERIFMENLGARSVKNVILNIANDSKLFDMIVGGYDVLRITEEVFTESAEPIMEKKAKKEKRGTKENNTTKKISGIKENGSVKEKGDTKKRMVV